MRNSFIIPESPTYNYVIQAEGIAETKYVKEKLLTNKEALKKIADYLDQTTAYLRKKRLAIK